MDIWCQIRERYAQGDITHKQLAEQFGVSLSTLRRKAADEKWSLMKKHTDSLEARIRLEKQLAVTDRLLDVFISALEKDAEFYTYIEQQKCAGGTEYVSLQMEVINIDRISKMIKAVGDIFELQRAALGLHDYKDELSAKKLEQDGDIANRKLELERLKIQGLFDDVPSDDGFLEALCAGATVNSDE